MRSVSGGGADDERSAIAALGGCDPVAAQAARSAHDLGHPPFGHLGEQVSTGSPGNASGLPRGSRAAQTFRILTALGTSDATERELNLTAAVRAAVLKYPWTRGEWKTADVLQPPELPGGVGTDSATGAQKFSAYSIDTAEMADAKAAYPAIAPRQQAVECSVMDIADIAEIAYSVHDLDDFYPAGVLQHTPSRLSTPAGSPTSGSSPRYRG